MRVGGLFSGGGGFEYAASLLGWDIAFTCEIDNFCKKILKYHFPDSEHYGNIEVSYFTKHRGKIDILCGGFPCQDASNANQSQTRCTGINGQRTGLLFEMLRVIRETRPRYVVSENVANILKVNGGRDFTRILTELARMGYNAEWRVCRASEVGAPHNRARLYMVAYPCSIRLQEGETFFSYVRKKTSPVSWRFAGTTVPLIRSCAWSDQPPILCVDNGVSSELGLNPGLIRNNLRLFGNAIVPQIAIEIFKAIEELENSLITA